MSPSPSLPSFFRDIASLLRALSEAIFVWPIFLSHHLWYSLTLASPTGSLTPVGPPTHIGHHKPMHGHLGSENRRPPRRMSRASRTRRDSSAVKVRRDLTPTPATRSRSSSSTTPSHNGGDKDATPMPSLADLKSHITSTETFTNVTRARIATQPLPTSLPILRKAKHARHFSASTDGTISSSEPDSERGDSSAGSSRSSSFSSESSHSALFDQPTSARTIRFRPHSFGLSNNSDTETGHSSGDASTVHGDDAGHALGKALVKMGETWEKKQRGKDDRRKEWEQERLVDAIERLQVSLLAIDEKEKEESSPGSVDTKVQTTSPTTNVRSPPKPTLRINSPPSITIVPPPPQVYDSDMDDDDEEDMTPTPTVENAMPPFRLQQHPQPSSNSSPIFINPFAPPGSSPTSASASSSTITLTSHNTSPTITSSSASPKTPSPKGSPTRRALRFLPGWDEKRSTSPSRLPTLPSMKKLFGGHRGGKSRSNGGRTNEEGVVVAE